jgi:type IX secretion system PorP/SprF family membrane protein
LAKFPKLRILSKYLLILEICLSISVAVFGQDPGFSQFYSNPLYLNPAFTGTLGVPRINLQYRDQWHALPNAYVTQSVSFDIPSEKLKGGIGINLIQDAQAANLLKTFQADLIYSSIFKLKEGIYFSGALEAGYHQNSLNWNNLIFADNLDKYTGSHGVTAETPISDPNFHYFDFSTGILVYGEKLFAGLAVHHLAQPPVSWYQGSDYRSLLHRKFTLHFGTRIPVFVHGHWRKTFDLSPQVVLMQQGIYRQFNYGMLANYHGFTAGTWLRQDLTFHYDAVVFLLGFMKKRWHITYSYDFTVSGLGAQSGGTSEISLSFLLKDFTRQTAFPFYRPYHDYIGE